MAFTLNRRLAQLIDSNGQLNTGKIPNDYITSDHVANNTITAAMLHTSFTVSTSNLSSIDTDDVSEGSSNLYFTNARARGAVSATGSISYNSSTGVFSFTQGNTDTISEGSSNLYYTDARADARIAAADTDDLSEGSTNLYYTNARANSAIDARVTKAFVDALGIQANTVAANSVALGTDTTGNYIQTITGTANKITVSGSGSESADVTLSLPDDVQIADSLTVAGNLTVNGTLTSLDTTNLDIEDNLFQLNAGLTGSPVNDSGMLINRGNQNNGIFMWDESADKFTLGLTTADGSSTGNITLDSLGTLVANIEGNVTGTIQTASQPNITSLGTLTGLTTSHDINIAADDRGLRIGADADLVLFHDAVDSTVRTSTGKLILSNTADNQDIIFKGKDAGGIITALTLDISDAGTAIFNHDIKLGDNGIAKFGAGSDLQIYHDGSDSYITDTTGGNFFINDNGSGYLMMKGSDLYFRNESNVDMIHAQSGGFVKLYHNGSQKLATTSTGINVTGTATMDGLSVDGAASIGTNAAKTKFYSDSTYNGIYNGSSLFSDESIYMGGDSMFFYAAGKKRLDINSGGDISFYEDTGTTAKFFWDASAERLGIGTPSPNSPLHVKTTNQSIQVRNTGNDNVGLEIYRDSDGAKGASFAWGNGNANLEIKNYRNDGQSAGPYANIDFFTGGTDADSPDFNPTRRMRIQQTGEVGIGIDNPAATLHTQSTVPDTNIRVGYDANKTTRIGTTSGGDAQIYAYETGVGYHNILLAVDSGSSAGNVGIGTTVAPIGTGLAVNSGISSSSTTAIEIQQNTNGANKAAAAFGIAIGNGGESTNAADLYFSTATGGALVKRMTIHSSGNVGIGHNNPSSFSSGANNLVVNDDAGAGGITIVTPNDAKGSIFFADGTSATGQGRIRYNHDGDYMTFGTSGTEDKVVIDTNGNLLVGTSTTILDAEENEEQGVDIRPAGFVKISRSNNFPLQLARTDDGDIIKFRSNENTVGSIGTEATDIYIGTTDTGIRFNDAVNGVLPYNTASGQTNGTIDLGFSSVRWKDLYLSGATKVGSTATEYAEGHIRFKFNGGAYIDQNTVGQSLNFRVSGSSSLDTTAMTLDSSGNVGIGTTPAKLLHLQNNTDPTIMLTKQYSSTTGSIGSIIFGNGNWDSSMASIRGIQDGTNDGGKLEFKTQSDASGGEVTRFTIFRTGLSTFNGPASSVNLGGGSAGSSALYVNSTSGHTGEMLQILKNGSSRMEMSNAGKLGIGIGGGSISSKLHVRGTQNNTISTANSFAAFDGTGGDGLIIGTRNSSPFEAYIQAGYTPNIGTSHHYPLVLNPMGGNVGIGTLNPSDKLHVDGNIKATGTNAIIDAGKRLTGRVQDMINIGGDNWSYSSRYYGNFGFGTGGSLGGHSVSMQDGQNSSWYSGLTFQGYVTWIPDVYIPYAIGQVYGLSATFFHHTNHTAGTAVQYVGCIGYDANFNFVNHDAIGTYQYNLASSASFTTGQTTELDVTLKGWQGSGQSDGNKMDRGTAYIRPMMLINYPWSSSSGGTTPTTTLMSFTMGPKHTCSDNDSNAGTNY